jgi:glycerol uptake facilitator-like aquaporin
MTAEFVGTAFLLTAVVGSGIMGERLSAGNVAITLLANTIATGAALVALNHALRRKLAGYRIAPSLSKGQITGANVCHQFVFTAAGLLKRA